jgi:hypothetical protein
MSKFGDFLQRNESSLVGAGTGLLGGLFSIGARKKAFKRSKQLMDKQFKMDKQMWDYQNAYNTPLNQMRRLKEAGLNPALMYGQGTTGNANNMVQSKFQELSPYMNATDIAQSTAAGVQMSLSNAQKANIQADTTYKAIKGANETGQLGVARELAASQIALQTQKIEESKQSIVESKDRVLTGRATRSQIQSSITNDVINRMQTFTNINLTNAQIQKVKADTNKIITDTDMARRIIALDYSGTYGKNTAENLRKLALQVNPDNEILGAATLLGSAALLRNPAALGRIGGAAATILKKNSKKLNQLYKNLKTYINWKLGRPGGFNIN